jgi:hypothetical protein
MKKSRLFFTILFIYIIATILQSNPAVQYIRALKDTVGQYEKFEAVFYVQAIFNNPFDPDEIDIRATFKSPSGKEWQIPGFYYYTYSLWMLRFSPDETGQWTYIIRVKDRQGSTSSNPDTFQVIPSKYHGPLKISANNHRYLEYSDGTSFYGVGLWYNSGLLPPGWGGKGHNPTEDLDQLKEFGVNFISAVMTPLETIGTGVGRYDQNICERVDHLLEWCEERDLILSLNIWFHAYLSETVWPGVNRRWHTNPYQYVCPAKEFFSSKRAWTYQEKLYRYIIARWAYSRSLGIWFIIDEVNGTDGWASGDTLGAAKWAQKVHDYFKANDPYNHPTTGTRSGGFQEFWYDGYRIFDMAAREIYEGQGFPILQDGKIDPGDTPPLKLSYTNYISEIRKLWNGYQKPVIIGETGWDHTFYEPGMPGYLALYHNALWAGLSTGMAMTPFWWAYSDYLNDNIVTHQLTSLGRFVARIPFARLTHVTPAESKISDGDAYAIKSDQLVFGWVVNSAFDVAGAVVTVSSLADGDYNLQLYHTWGGRFFHEQKIAVSNGTVNFTIPAIKIVEGRGEYVGQDVAFVLRPVVD